MPYAQYASLVIIVKLLYNCVELYAFACDLHMYFVEEYDMMQLAICDDDDVFRKFAAKIAESALDKVPHFIRLFDNPTALQLEISEGGYLPDIAVLDIQMAQMDGITLAKGINHLAPSCRVIFISNYNDYLMDAYETEHVYYVLKSDIENRLPAALEKALKTDDAHRHLIIKIGSQRRVIPLCSVFSLERQLHKTLVHTEHEDIETTQSPAELISTCGAACEFIRCHQSYWVNCRAIASMEADCFILSDGSCIPISRARKPEARDAFFRLLSGSAVEQ